MKNGNYRRKKKREFHINRLKKLMKIKHKRKKCRKQTKRKNGNKVSNYLIGTEYINNRVIKLLNEKKFQMSYSKKGNRAKIEIPPIFSLCENADKSIETLKKIYSCMMNPKIKELELDYRKCKKLSLGVSCVMDIITLNTLEHREKSNNRLNLKGTYPDRSSEAFEIFVISGLVKHLKIVDLENKNVKSLDIIINGEQSYVGEEIIKYYDDCLNTKGYSLSKKGKSRLSEMITEVVDNVGEHAGELASWYTQGHYTIGPMNKPGKFRLVLFNFGDTIYEGLKRKSSSNYTKKVLNNATKKHNRKKLFGINWNEELLWTLFSLQYKISRCNYSSQDDRGVGTIDLIENFLGLGKTVEEIPPIMSIISGKANIIFDGTYKIHSVPKNGYNVPTIAFNKNNNLFEKQDEKYVKPLKNYFPGTVIDMEFYIDKNYLDNIKENKI